MTVEKPFRTSFCPVSKSTVANIEVSEDLGLICYCPYSFALWLCSHGSPVSAAGLGVELELTDFSGSGPSVFTGPHAKCPACFCLGHSSFSTRYKFVWFIVWFA